MRPRPKSPEVRLIAAALTQTNQRLTMVEAKALIRTWLDAVARECERGKRVHVPGFGIFYRAQSKARRIRNPVTGELMRLPKQQRLGFRAAGAQKWAP